MLFSFLIYVETVTIRVHEFSYLSHIEEVANGKALYDGWLDNDTPLTSELLSAAKSFCGYELMQYLISLNLPKSCIHRAAMLAVDLLMQKVVLPDARSYSRALVIGRPPGHHAGPNGFVLHHLPRHRCSLIDLIAAAWLRSSIGSGQR
jgi:acetoin utilization deacetylase AcuC-like enzyme